MHLRPKGYAPTTREQSVEHIRAEVQRDLGEEAAKKRNDHRDTKNQEIDRTIDDALSRQQGRSTREDQFKENARDVSTSREQKGWDRHTRNEPSQSREASGWNRHRGNAPERKP